MRPNIVIRGKEHSERVNLEHCIIGYEVGPHAYHFAFIECRENWISFLEEAQPAIPVHIRMNCHWISGVENRHIYKNRIDLDNPSLKEDHIFDMYKRGHMPRAFRYVNKGCRVTVGFRSLDGNFDTSRRNRTWSNAQFLSTYEYREPTP